MNALKEFEEKNRRLFPPSVRNVLSFQVENKTKIQFEVPTVGTFELLDFNKSTNSGSSDSEGQYSNPYLLVPTIDKHLDDFYPVINFSNVIPFARSTWGDSLIYLVAEENSGRIIVINIDSNATKPLELNLDVATLIDIDHLVKKNDVLYYSCQKNFKNIISPDKYFLGVPDCIYAVDDYKEMFRKSFVLTGMPIDFEFQPQGNSRDSYSFAIKIGELSNVYTVKRFSDLISGDEFVRILNDILIKTKISNGSFFYELSYDAFDFGIVYTDTETAALLRANGYLLATRRSAEFTDAEKQAIEDALDTKREIENIAFHLKIITENNLSVEHKNTTVHFSYDTTFTLDENGIKLLKKTTKINKVEKTDSGYNFYFYVD